MRLFFFYLSREIIQNTNIYSRSAVRNAAKELETPNKMTQRLLFMWYAYRIKQECSKEEYPQNSRVYINNIKDQRIQVT